MIEDWRRAFGAGREPRSDVITFNGATICIAVDVVHSKSPDKFELHTQGLGYFEAVFDLSPAKNGWDLRSPRLSDPRTGITIDAVCTQHLQFDGKNSTPAVAQTSGGPIYTDAALCHANAESGYEYSCVGMNCDYAPTSVCNDCKYSQSSALVFSLGNCKNAIQTAISTLSSLTNATESQRVNTMQKALKLWRDGGRLFSRSDMREQQSCLVWDVRPQAELNARLSTSYQDKFTASCEYELEPLEHRALQWCRSSGERESSAVQGPAALHFGANKIYLGDTWFYFSRAACEEGK